MALISPVLDNRTYEQLKDELIGRIPVYTKEWTDYNESSPAVALLELFAHLGESLLYRFNQIPETTQIEFLRLLGVRPGSAQPARALLAASTELPAGAQVLKGAEAPAGEISFETDDEVYVWPLDVIAAGKTPDTSATLTKQDKERRADAAARANVPEKDAQFYQTTVLSADPLAPDAKPLDIAAQVDQSLWVALLAKPTTDVSALAGRTVFIGVAFDETIDPPTVLDNLDADDIRRFGSENLTRDPPAVTWQVWNGPSPNGPDFTKLAVIGDTTRGLLTSGVVKVVLPATLPRLADPADGVRGSPPRLDDDELAKKVVAWIRAFRPPTNPAQLADAICRVKWVGVNAVQATQARTATAELLGSGSGDADQTYSLTHQLVLPKTVDLEVEEGQGWVGWSEVENFVASKPTDRHYTVDLTAGTVTFAGLRVPQIGERIRVLRYRYGGGVGGNVGAKSITGLSATAGIDATNVLPAVGGSDAVGLTEALDQIPAIVHRHDRAVIAADFEQLAREVNGVERADTLPRMHPDNPRDEAAGVISVVVFGPGDASTSAAPFPDYGLLTRVARYLDARRLVTTELYVIPPEYVKIAISVGVQVREGYQADAVRRWVEKILRQYLAPLPTGGPDGCGWPLGRAVRRAELEAVAVQVEGVEYLQDLLLGSVTAGGIVESSLIQLERWQVPAITGVTVSVGDPLKFGEKETPKPPPKVPVPLPVEVC
jgi:predicted phage baseplate assembly protein